MKYQQEEYDSYMSSLLPSFPSVQFNLRTSRRKKRTEDNEGNKVFSMAINRLIALSPG
jgi:hypothetical protein